MKNVSAHDAGQLMKEGWVLLDVRPEEEVNKVRVLGAVEVPVYVRDNDPSLSTSIKHVSGQGAEVVRGEGCWCVKGLERRARQRPQPLHLYQAREWADGAGEVRVRCLQECEWGQSWLAITHVSCRKPGVLLQPPSGTSVAGF